jgi:ATP/maltotriose-dependent transcriptional regulator MalT
MAELRRAAYTLYLFHDLQSRYREGSDLFERAIHALSHAEPTPELGPALAELLVYQGWLSIRLGQLQQAKAVLERSQAILDRLDVPPQPGPATDPLVPLGVVACALGQYTEAARLGDEARRRNQARADRGNEMYAYYVLTNAAFAQGHYDAARRYAQQACALAEALQDRWFMAYLFGDMGHVARALGDYASARQHYQASYSIREEFGDPEGIAVTLTHLGQVALLQADYAEAGTLFQRSMAIYHEIGDRGGLATALHGLGMLAGATGAYAAAGQHLHEALQIAAAIGYAMRTLAILTSIAELLLLSAAPAQAVELLTVILGHPASDHETCDRARKLLLRCQAELAPDAFAAAGQHGQTLDLDMALARLPIAFGTGAPHTTTLVSTPSQPAPLEEPLSEREIAVLRLIADGRSNREIADRLIISLGTTKWYISQIFGKLQVHSRTQAVMRARALDILT